MVELEQRVFVVQDLEVRMGALETHFMLVECFMSGLTALQQIFQASQTGQGAALRQCLRIFIEEARVCLPGSSLGQAQVALTCTDDGVCWHSWCR